MLFRSLGALPEATSGVMIERSGGGGLVLDATFESKFSLTAEVTENAVENNDGDVTDHRRTKPAVWRFRSVLLAEDPDPIVAAQRSASANGSKNDPLKSARENGPQVDPWRAMTLLEELISIFKSHEVVRVTTDFGYMQNAVLESLEYFALTAGSAPLRTSPTPGLRAQIPTSIEVSGSFREIRFAATETVELPAEPVKRQTGETKNAGTANGKTTTPEVKAESQSILRASRFGRGSAFPTP